MFPSRQHPKSGSISDNLHLKSTKSPTRWRIRLLANGGTGRALSCWPVEYEGMAVGIILMAVSGATFLFVAWMFRDSGMVSGVIGVFVIFC